jgi:hypothetical protein
VSFFRDGKAELNKAQAAIDFVAGMYAITGIDVQGRREGGRDWLGIFLHEL